MYRGHSIGVVVPAYDEEAHIGDVLATMPPFVDKIYVVDDCSTDRTWEIVREWATARTDVTVDETHPGEGTATTERPSIADGGTFPESRIVTIRHRTNRGAGAALRTGYLRAREDGVDITATMDADGQMDPDRLPALLDPIVEGDAEYAKGNRLARYADRRAMPAFRLFGNGLLTLLTRIASGYWHLQDPQNGYTAISREALSAIDVEELPDDHDYPNDLLVRLNTTRMRVADVSMPAVYGSEESTIRYRTFVLTTSTTLLRGFLRRLKAQTAMRRIDSVALCYGSALLAGAAIAVHGAAMAVNAATGGSLIRATAAEIGLGVAASVVMLIVAMALDAQANEELGVRR